jgi:hypothetical protein
VGDRHTRRHLRGALELISHPQPQFARPLPELQCLRTPPCCLILKLHVRSTAPADKGARQAGPSCRGSRPPPCRSTQPGPHRSVNRLGFTLPVAKLMNPPSEQSFWSRRSGSPITNCSAVPRVNPIRVFAALQAVTFARVALAAQVSTQLIKKSQSGTSLRIAHELVLRTNPGPKIRSAG